MNTIWYEELRKKHYEIQKENQNPIKIEKVIEAYNRIFEFSNIARKEGLLELEEAKDMLDTKEETAALFYELIGLIVDGVDSEFVRMIGINKCISLNLQGYYGLAALLYIQGSVMIQAGENPRIIEAVLKSMMPKVVLEELAECEKDSVTQTELKTNEECKRIINQLCNEQPEVEGAFDNTLVREAYRIILMLSDFDLQRILRNIYDNSISAIVKGADRAVREKLLKNISPRRVVSLASGQWLGREVSISELVENCAVLLRLIMNYHDSGMIHEYDFSGILKILDGEQI